MRQASVCPEDCGLEVNSHFFPEVPEKCLLLESHTHPRVVHTGWGEAKAEGGWSGAGARDGVHVPGRTKPQSRMQKDSQAQRGEWEPKSRCLGQPNEHGGKAPTLKTP